ncbi:MAG TPA: lmo0937 family membrane protein [Candidatus Acidoferrales bacterium]|nr:lmo0937 family membrane protein [Candidatus Acidoferrales bacterium]
MRNSPIFIILFAVLLVLWLGGFLVFHVASAMIHLLLVLAVISLLFHFLRGRTTT